jgi:hypothetical protein
MRRIVVSSLCALSIALTGCSPSRIGSAGIAPSQPVPVVIWSSQDLPKGLDVLVARIDGVRWANPVSIGMVNLVAVTGAKPLPARPPGAILPVSVGALDPTPGGTDTVSRTLARGEAVLTTTAAALRGMKVGSSLTVLGGGARRGFRVGAIVPDAEGRHRELLIPLRYAAALRLSQPRAIITSVAGDRVTQVVRAMQQLTRGVPARIESGGADVAEGTGENVLSFEMVKRIFGEFTYRPTHAPFVAPDQAWVDRNIVQVRVPLLGLIACNRRLIPQLTSAMNELVSRGLGGLVRTANGCYSPRMQTDNPYALSRHAFGIAVDINAGTNRYGDPPAQDPRLVEVMERWGFTWGGRWLIPDGMHFEFVRFP